MIKPTEEEVRYAIESSGYPLEIRVAHQLAKRSYFEVTPSWNYRDDKSGESREIDVVASQFFNIKHKGVNKPSLMLHLLIECKRSPAFVIYSAHPREILTDPGYDSMSLSYFGRPYTMWTSRHKTGWSGREIIDHLEFGAERWKWPDCVGSHYSFVQTRHDEQKRTRKFKVGDDEFYQKKLLGLLKGAFKYQEPYTNHKISAAGVQPRFVIPLLVVDSDLYEYDVANTSLRRIRRAALCRSYQGEFAARFRIDVLEENELDSYLDTLEGDFSNIALQIGKEYPLWEQAIQAELEMSKTATNT